MVGEAAKGLGADHVAVAQFRQFHHLGGQEPPLPHLAAVADDPLDQALGVLVGGGGNELGVPLDGVDEFLFHSGKVLHQHGAEGVLGGVAAVEFDVLQAVVHLEHGKAHDAGYHVLAALAAEEGLQVVVAQAGVLDVDLPHHPHLDPGYLFHRHLGEALGDAGQVLPHLAHGDALPGV